MEKAAAAGPSAPQQQPGRGYVSDRLVATPAAKKLAKAKGVDLSKVKGSGNFGRITPDDVLVAAGEPPKAAAAPAAAAPAAPAAAAAKEKTKGASPAERADGVTAMNAMQKARPLLLWRRCCCGGAVVVAV